MKVTTFRELMNGHATAEIRCLYTGNLVRKLAVTDDVCEIDPCIPHPVIRVPIDTPVTYEPWVFDRGNMLFAESALIKDYDASPSDTRLKICGEHDRITFPDGTTDYVDPA